MAGSCAQEYDSVVAGGRGCHGGEMRVEHQHWYGGNGLLTAQRGVHIKAAEILSYRLQFL